MSLETFWQEITELFHRHGVPMSNPLAHQLQVLHINSQPQASGQPAAAPAAPKPEEKTDVVHD